MNTPSKHKQGSPKKISFAVVIVSDSRYNQFINSEIIKDETTPLIKSILYKHDLILKSHQYTPDEKSAVTKTLLSLLSSDVDIIVFSGGTGLAKRDITIETIEPLFEKKIPGFGELLRSLSYKEIKSASMLSRATAGILKGKVIFCIPGSPNAAKIAFENLIIPESGHILKHVK